MEEKRILLVGVCVLDVIQEVEEFPEEDHDVRTTAGRWQRGGNPSNNCTILTSLGEKCELLTTFSASKMFQFALDDLKDRNIEIKNCVFYNDCNIPLSTVILSKKTGSRTIIHTSTLPGVKFEDFDKCNLDEYKWIHFEARDPENISQMMIKIKQYNLKQSLNNRIKISLDLEKKRQENLQLIKHADVVFLGKDYAQLLGCEDMKTAVYTLRDVAQNMMDEESFNNLLIICPWSEQGCSALHKNNYFESKAFPPTKIIDTLGAGDTFVGGCLYLLNKNYDDVSSAIKFGCQLAGYKIGHYGYDCIGDFKME